jgi:hypothetical protein
VSPGEGNPSRPRSLVVLVPDDNLTLSTASSVLDSVSNDRPKPVAANISNPVQRSSF